MIQQFQSIDKIGGTLKLPGDKSISHRAAIFSALALGRSTITNISNGKDVKSTLGCLEQLGCKIEVKENSVVIYGRGFKNFQKPVQPLDAGNSGTTARLLAGIVAAQNFESVIIGDESLSKRPMKRIVEPLRKMGGDFKLSSIGSLPMTIHGTERVIPVKYEMPIASAQVKSAVLLCGLHSEDLTKIIERIPTRDHTERMLNLKTEFDGNKKIIFSSKDYYPSASNYFIPADISTASFFIVLTLLSKNSELIVKDVSLNETRTGIITVLKKMGGNIEIIKRTETAGEPYGNLLIRSSELKNIHIDKKIIPNIIDEIPILSIAGIFAEGKFSISGAKELRTKESDRIAALCSNFIKLGIEVDEHEDGFSISGSIKQSDIVFESFHDHRIAMAFSILSILLKGGGKVDNFESVKISNPEFLSQLKQIVR